MLPYTFLKDWRGLPPLLGSVRASFHGVCSAVCAPVVAVGRARQSLLAEMTAHVVPVTFHLASGCLFILLNCTGGWTE